MELVVPLTYQFTIKRFTLMESKQIAINILNQLGGYNRLNAMIGLKDVIAHQSGVSFKIKCQGAKANYVKIILNGLDLYDVEIGKIRGLNYTVKKSVNDYYCDMLKELIENETGLRLSL